MNLPHGPGVPTAAREDSGVNLAQAGAEHADTTLEMLRENEPRSDARVRDGAADAVRASGEQGHNAPTAERRRVREWIDDRPIGIDDVDLAETVRAVAAALGATGRVVMAIPEGTVTTDRSRIVEILSYLLENALMHSPDRSAVIVCADSDKSGLRVWVDSRIGIDPAHRAEVFARFRRIDRSVTPLYGGSGLGLHLAKHAIEESRERFELGSPDRSSAPTAPGA